MHFISNILQPIKNLKFFTILMNPSKGKNLSFNNHRHTHTTTNTHGDQTCGI